MSQRAAARRESVCNSLDEKSRTKDKNEKLLSQQEHEKQARKIEKKEKESDKLQFDKDFNQFKTEIKDLFKQFDENIDKKLNKLDQKFTAVFDDLRKDIGVLKIEVCDAKDEVKGLKSKVAEMETSVSFCADNQDTFMERQEDRLSKYKFELDEMKKKVLLLEKYDRKYNLLFYGMEEDKDEKLSAKMRTFFREKLEIPGERAEAMLFVNCHRTSYEGAGPKPVILRFVSFEDRELVYSKAFLPVLREERKRILSDLPMEMKVTRSKLAKEAYKLRKEGGMKTRIIERGLSVYLEARKTTRDPWERKDVEI